MDRCVLSEKAGKKESEQLCALACKLEARWTAGAGQQIGKQVVLPPQPFVHPYPQPFSPTITEAGGGVFFYCNQGVFREMQIWEGRVEQHDSNSPWNRSPDPLSLVHAESIYSQG